MYTHTYICMYMHAYIRTNYYVRKNSMCTMTEILYVGKETTSSEMITSTTLSSKSMTIHASSVRIITSVSMSMTTNTSKSMNVPAAIHSNNVTIGVAITSTSSMVMTTTAITTSMFDYIRV